jgi:hypothetical protein
LLIEEQRTNKLIYSSNVGGSLGGWNAASSGVTINENSAISPDGTQTASYLQNFATQTDPDLYIRQSFTLSGGETITHSIYVKAPDASQVGKEINFRGKRLLGTISTWGSKFILTSEWKRISITHTYLADNTLAQFYIGSDPNTTHPEGAATECLVWGAQVEVGSFPTSYIPTSGSQVTRQPDITKITGTNLTSFYNQSEGTVFASFRPLPSSSGTKYVQSGTIGSTLEMLYIRTTATGSDTAIADGNVTQYYKKIDYTRSEQENSKHAYAYALNNSNVSAQGILGSVDTSCTMPTITRFDIGSLYQDSTTFLNGHISQLIYYPARISDIKLQQMTKVFS